MNTVRLGTRQTPLAMAQTKLVQHALQQQGIKTTLVPFSTSGDRFLKPLRFHGGKGLFIKEIEEALLQKDIDVAVHSYKDMPHQETEGLCVVATPRAEVPQDLWVLRQKVPQGLQSQTSLTVGTCSLRRKWQLLHAYPKLRVVEMRGSVGTRLDKLEKGDVDALILAGAGLQRLGLMPLKAPLSFQWLTIQQMVPAVGQGVLALQCRCDDQDTIKHVACLTHKITDARLKIERAFLRTIEGTCETPVGGYADVQKEAVHLSGFLCAPNGDKAAWLQKTVAIKALSSTHDDLCVVGQQFAKALMDQHQKSCVSCKPL